VIQIENIKKNPTIRRRKKLDNDRWNKLETKRKRREKGERERESDRH
jgi:hypothetical protein